MDPAPTRTAPAGVGAGPVRPRRRRPIRPGSTPSSAAARAPAEQYGLAVDSTCRAPGRRARPASRRCGRCRLAHGSHAANDATWPGHRSPSPPRRALAKTAATAAGAAPSRRKGRRRRSARRSGSSRCPSRAAPTPEAALEDELRLGPEERGPPQDDVGELAGLERPDLVRDPVREGRVDRQLGDVAQRALVVVPSPPRRRRASSRARAARSGGSPRRSAPCPSSPSSSC